MKAVKKIEISVLHKRITPIVYAVQGDTGREIECTVVDWDIPAGVAARVWVVKPSKKVVYNDCRIVDKAVFVPMTNQTLAEPGGAICMIEFVSGEDVVSSFSFNLYVYESASGDGIESNNESTVLEKMFEELAQDAIKTLNEAKAQAAAAKKSAQDTEKIKNDFTLTAQQAVADVNNAGQAQTQRVNTAGDTQVSRIQAEGTTQIQNVQATAAEISADREQIHTNRDNTARLQRATAGAITRSAEGSFVTLEDAADEMGFRRLEVPGMTEQRTTTGAQLLECADTEKVSNGTKLSITNGNVHLAGTATGSGGRLALIVGTVTLIPGTYTLCASEKTNCKSIMCVTDKANTASMIASTSENLVGNVVFTLAQKKEVIIGINVESGIQYNESFKVMLNAGETALPWEPYTGSKPSPSPEYPQELENVGVLNEAGKYEVKVTACKNNLLDMTGAKGATDAGITATVNPDGSYTSNGTATSGTINIWLLGNYIQNYTDKNILMVLAPGKTYRIVDVVLFTGTDYAISPGVFYVDPKIYPDGYKVTGVRHPTLDSGTVLTNKVYHPRVILGDTDTGWEPYRGHTATITSDRPLTKWDKLTCRDGVWGWAYGGTKYICSLNEAISQHGASIGKKYPCMTFSMKGKARDAGEVCACNYLKSVGSEVLNGNAIGIWGNTNPTYKNYVYIGIPYSVLGTTIDSTADENTAAMTAWLNAKKEAGAPVTIEYKLAEEEWVPLSAEEQAAMNALCTYAGTTHIWTDDTLQPVISLDYTVDTEGYIKDTTPAYRDVGKFALTGEVSGTVATCTDSAEWPLLGVGMKGKCEQTKTTGAQLFDASRMLTATVGGATLKNNGDGSFTITGSGAMTERLSKSFEYSNEESKKVFKAGTIKLKGNNKTNPYFYVLMLNDSGPINEFSGGEYDLTQDIIDSPGFMVRFGIYGTEGSTIIPGTIRPMLYQGEDETWEPYTGAAPSHSPAYKQEIQETGTYNPETGMYEAGMVMTGAQLLDWEYIAAENCALVREGAIRSNITGGYFCALATTRFNDYIPTHKGEQITLSCKGNPAGARVSVVIYGTYSDGKSSKEADTAGNNVTCIIPEDVLTVNKCEFRFNRRGAAFTDTTTVISDIMLNIRDTALPWEPYKGMQSLRLTADQPWRGIGDVHDEVCDRDGVLGTWRRLAVVDNGKWETCGIASGTVGKRFRISLTDIKKPIFSQVVSSHFVQKTVSSYGVNGTYIATSEIGYIHIRVEDDFPATTAEEFRAWAQENGLYTIYLLETPVWEPFPEDVQRAYRKLKSYAGTTHAWVDDPLQPEVSFRYIKDSKLILSKLEDRLTALEAGQAQTAAAFGYLPADIQAEMIENETNQLIDSI